MTLKICGVVMDANLAIVILVAIQNILRAVGARIMAGF